MKRELETMPYDHVFWTSQGEELCHATGYEVCRNGEWWNEYQDSDGEYHYGR